MVISIEVGYVLKTKFQIEFKRMHIIFLTDKSLSFYLASRFLTFPIIKVNDIVLVEKRSVKTAFLTKSFQ